MRQGRWGLVWGSDHAGRHSEAGDGEMRRGEAGGSCMYSSNARSTQSSGGLAVRANWPGAPRCRSVGGDAGTDVVLARRPVLAGRRPQELPGPAAVQAAGQRHRQVHDGERAGCRGRNSGRESASRRSGGESVGRQVGRQLDAQSSAAAARPVAAAARPPKRRPRRRRGAHPTGGGRPGFRGAWRRPGRHRTPVPAPSRRPRPEQGQGRAGQGEEARRWVFGKGRGALRHAVRRSASGPPPAQAHLAAGAGHEDGLAHKAGAPRVIAVLRRLQVGPDSARRRRRRRCSCRWCRGCCCGGHARRRRQRHLGKHLWAQSVWGGRMLSGRAWALCRESQRLSRGQRSHAAPGSPEQPRTRLGSAHLRRAPGLGPREPAGHHVGVGVGAAHARGRHAGELAGAVQQAVLRHAARLLASMWVYWY